METSKKNNDLMSQIGNADETPLQFGMPPNYTVDYVQAQSLVIKTLHYDTMYVTVMLVVFSCTNDSKRKFKRSTHTTQVPPAALAYRELQSGGHRPWHPLASAKLHWSSIPHNILLCYISQ
jgi:hypothetical protein